MKDENEFDRELEVNWGPLRAFIKSERSVIVICIAVVLSLALIAFIAASG